MAKNYYLLKSGRLYRHENTVYFDGSDGDKKAIPIQDIESLYLMGEVELNTKLLNFLAQNKITVHIFNYYGYYSGSYYPREYLTSGLLLVKQVEHYTDKAKRMAIASEIVRAAVHNMLKNLKYYNLRGATTTISEIIKEIEKQAQNIEAAESCEELMGIEGLIRQNYYKAFNFIIKGDYEFERRVKQPPDNIINALISFGNSLVYTECLSQIYHTQLNPTISFLHEPSQRRFSLSLDIAEVFKPLLCDRIIFKLLNQGMLKEKDFDQELNYCYLKDAGRRLFLEEFDEKLKTTLQHRKLNRQVSYKRLIRLECYKLSKHILGETSYEGFKIWW